MIAESAKDDVEKELDKIIGDVQDLIENVYDINNKVLDLKKCLYKQQNFGSYHIMHESY